MEFDHDKSTGRGTTKITGRAEYSDVRSKRKGGKHLLMLKLSSRKWL